MPCSVHSLNLVGLVRQNAVIFLHHSLTYLSAHRWNILEPFFKPGDMNLSKKSLTIIRWSVRKEVCRSFNRDFVEIANALKSMTNSEDENEKTEQSQTAFKKTCLH